MVRHLERDVRLPMVLQRMSKKGALRSTEFIAAGTVLHGGERIKEVRKAPVLLIAGAGTLAASAGLYGGAFASKSAFNDAKDTRELDRIQSTFQLNRGLVVGSAALAGAGAALILGHLFTR